jgi:Prolipoprotein diacylglyceryltransferase
MIFIGIVMFAYAVLKDPQRKKLISTDQFFDLMTLGIAAGIIGGRLLFLLTNRSEISSLYDCIAIWDGGFSVMGSVVGILVTAPFYLKAKKINVLELLDLIAIYAPLLQSASRIGCFFAGCCYGSPTSVFWAVRCSEPCGAGVYVHPTQLYSSAILFLLFLIMRYPGRTLLKKPGQLMILYLILVSGERFVVDFWRGDREYVAQAGFWGIFSVHQYIAIGLCVVALIIMVMITVRAQQKNESV